MGLGLDMLFCLLAGLKPAHEAIRQPLVAFGANNPAPATVFGNISGQWRCGWRRLGATNRRIGGQAASSVQPPASPFPTGFHRLLMLL